MSRWITLLPVACAALGCVNELGINPIGTGGSASSVTSGGNGSSGGSGGTATTAAAGSTSSTTQASSTGSATLVCTPGETKACYDGPPATQDVGVCRGGTTACAADGSAFGPCLGEVLPASVEICSTPEDDDCDGSTIGTCGLLALPPDATHFGWQSLQERFVDNGTECAGRVTIAVGDQAVCFAASDNHLHCAGHVYDADYGSSFTDVGLVDPVQIFISPTANSATGNAMCVLLGDGTLQCRGNLNDWGQFGGSVGPASAFAPWGGRQDIYRAATGTWDQFCVLTTGGQTYCSGYGFGSTPVASGTASTLWVDAGGALHNDDASVYRAANDRTDCQVTTGGLSCMGQLFGVPGAVVTGGNHGGPDMGCRLEANGVVKCFETMGTNEATYFDAGDVLSIATNLYTDSLCAVYIDGSLHCMGANTHGELGTGNTLPLDIATQVAPPGSVRIDCQ